MNTPTARQLRPRTSRPRWSNTGSRGRRCGRRRRANAMGPAERARRLRARVLAVGREEDLRAAERLRVAAIPRNFDANPA